MKIKPLLKLSRLALLASAGALLAPSTPARAEKILLLTADSRLVTIDSAAPGQIIASVPIAGVTAGETLLGLDVRPRDGSLVALSSGSRLYNIAAATGAASAIGTTAFTPALNGTSFGFDFNPTVDRIRVVSDARQNLRLNPDTGATAAVDGTETFGPADANAARVPATTAAAYTSNGPNATVTQLYVIDTNAGVLALQNPPNNGTLVTVGSLGVSLNSAISGFDISNLTERGYATLTVTGVQTLYSVNLATGAATSLGALPTGLSVTDLTVPTPNAVRRQRASGYVERGKPIFADFTVGAPGLGATSGAPVRVLVRGLGPSLATDGVPAEAVLANPRFTVTNSTGTTIAKVDDYTSGAQVAEITASGFAPSSSLEPAVILSLQPGGYAVQLSPKGSGQGTARIEVIELD